MDHVIKKYQLNRVRSEVLGRLGDDYFEHIGCQHQLGTQSLNCELCARFLKDQSDYHSVEHLMNDLQRDTSLSES